MFSFEWKHATVALSLEDVNHGDLLAVDFLHCLHGTKYMFAWKRRKLKGKIAIWMNIPRHEHHERVYEYKETIYPYHAESERSHRRGRFERKIQ